jgi:Mg2+ and Co2+ transporter CorA
MEILTHYEDKIYIGRDFIDIYNFKRKYFGVRELIASLKDQCEKLVDRAEEKLKKPLEYKSFFQEIKESVSELNSECRAILEPLPPYLDFAKLAEQDLIDINAQYRSINHYLIELHDEVGEFENLLRFKMEIDFVRYVTKYKKDVTNLISYFNIKINGCLSQRIYHYRHR